MNTFKLTSLFDFVLCSVVLASWSYCMCQRRGEMQYRPPSRVSCPQIAYQYDLFSSTSKFDFHPIMEISNNLMSLP